MYSLEEGRRLNNYIGIAKKAALRSGGYLKKRQNLGVISNQPRDVKLAADLESERIIVEVIQSESNITILAEESGFISKGTRSDTKWLWIVDPLDGSYNYKNNIPFCCVSIALWDDNSPLLGIVYDFDRGEMFEGIVNNSARQNGRAIHVSSIRKMSDAVLCTGFPVGSGYGWHELNHWANNMYGFKKARMLGSAALSLGYLAAGRVDAYEEEGIMLWDVAAGLAIVVAAGGGYEMRPYRDEAHCVTVKASNRCLALKET